MSDEDSLERRRREREERRRQREEEMRREEEELEKAREQRRLEREERRRQREAEEAAELARIDANRSGRTPRTTEVADESKKDEEEDRRQKAAAERAAAEEQEERKRTAEREERQRKREEEEKAQAEEAERKRKEEQEAQEKEKERERRRQQEKEEEEREKERDRRRKEEREAEEREKERERKRQEEREAEEREREREERRRRREAEEKEREREDEEARRRKAALEERHSRAAAAAADDDGDDAPRKAASSEEESRLRSENSELKSKCSSLERELEELRGKLADKERENASLKKEVEKLTKDVASAASTAAAASSSSSSDGLTLSSAPRLTGTTRSRPTKAGRRGQTVRPSSSKADDEDEDGDASDAASAEASSPKEEAKPVPVRSSGNKAADLLAATMRGAMSSSGGIAGLKKASGGNVFVSAGTKGGEISRCLFQLKGKVRIRAVRVQDSAKSITNNDVFILETKTHIWTFIGKSSNRLKIARAVDVVGKMQRQRGQARAAILVTVDTKQKHDVNEERREKEFWGEFEEGAPSEIPDGEDDTEWEKNFEARTSLFRVDPGFNLELISQGRLQQEQLESDKIFLLDTPNELFVWCGKASDVEERRLAVEGAQAMLEKTIKDGLKPAWVEVERVAERGEGALFEDKFFKWSDSMRAVIGKVQHKALSNVALSDTEKKQELPRIKEMHDGELEPPTEYTDDVSGTPEITIVKDFRRQEVPKDQHGIFYTKHCYVMLYRYDDTGVFYYWIGRDAGVTEIGSAASLTKEWAGEAGLNRPNLVRVDQGHEPRHFLRLFKGRMVALLGEQGGEPKTKSLFHIRGTEEGDTRTFECPDVNGIYLNSDDAFVLNTKDSQYAWIGKHCAGLLHKVTDHIANLVRGSRGTCHTVEEGSESSAFKDAIGWTPDYAKHETRPNNLPFKLFICSNSNKQYRADRVVDYVQSDLSHGCQAILDRHSEVLVWLGRDTKKEDKKIALEVAIDYVDKADDGRKNCKVWVIDEGEEVVDFSRYFQAWDPWRMRSSKKHVTQGPPKPRKEAELVDAKELLSGATGGKKYPLKQLIDRDYLPVGVDKKCLENFLIDDDFPEAFGLTAAEFWALPAWKRLQKKKGSVLF